MHACACLGHLMFGTAHRRGKAFYLSKNLVSSPSKLAKLLTYVCMLAKALHFQIIIINATTTARINYNDNHNDVSFLELRMRIPTARTLAAAVRAVYKLNVEYTMIEVVAGGKKK